MQFKGKLMYQTCEKGKKPSFGPDFDLQWGTDGQTDESDFTFHRMLPY